MKYIATTALLILILTNHVQALSERDFQIIGNRYGVSADLLQSIGIVESQGGKLKGTHEVRKVISKEQISFLKKIAKNTNRSVSDFKGSSSGAMGYMQIIPSTFHYYAQDGNGDRIRDPLDDYDSLATAAYYLARNIKKEGCIKSGLLRYNNSQKYVRKVLILYKKMMNTRTLTMR